MATPPVFVSATTVSSWTTTTTPKTVAVTVANGDLLVVVALNESDTQNFTTPTGGSLTYTSQQMASVTNTGVAQVWTAPSSSGQSFSVSVGTASATVQWGFIVYRFSTNGGVGVSNKVATGTATGAITLAGASANSALVYGSVDWNAVDGATRTYNTANVAITEEAYNLSTGQYTIYSGYYSDCGGAGSKTVGVATPTGQKNNSVVVEVKGTAGGATTKVNPLQIVNSSALMASVM